jgi:hypothetical protein
MEDHNGAPSDSVATAPFSELISAWLDEGDRLDEKAIATTASVPPVVETRARRLVARLRPAFDRHRVLVLAGLGLVPLALFMLTARSAATPAPALAIAPATLAGLTARPLPAIPTPLVASMLPRPSAPSEAPGFCEQPQARATVAELRSPDPRLAPQRHHRHHSVKPPAACGLHGPCAVKRPTAPSAHAASVASARPGPGPAPGHGQARR